MILSDFQKEIIQKTSEYVRQKLAGAEGGHDWWHIYRVWKLTKKIGTEEGADLFVVELAALLHDIADPKFHDGDEEIGPKLAKEFLEKQGVDEAIIDHIDKIIRNISFKNSFENTEFRTKELDVVQDTDRLDAIGAIGIARAFNYGGFKNRLLYDPGIPPDKALTKEAYKNSVSPTINHFYEKLLLLKDLMNTPTGKRMAEERHHFMEIYLERFYNEWEGRD
jgi:uncharacterized protein